MRLNRLIAKQDAALRRERELGHALFTEIRDRYAANLCGYIRTYSEAERAGIKLPEPYRSVEWCNTAVHLLTVCTETVQDRFIKSDARTKDTIVNAVLDDGGILDAKGYFSELPPC